MRASIEILEEEGVDALTVQAVVRRARSSVGSFYARFEGKEDLLAYVGEQIWSEAASRWDSAFAECDFTDRPLAELVDGCAALLVEASASPAGALLALERAGEPGAASFARFRSHVLERLEELLLTRVDELVHAEPRIAVPLGLRAVASLGDAASDGRWLAPPPERLAEEAGVLLRRYLLGDDATAAGRGQVEFFDIWG